MLFVDGVTGGTGGPVGDFSLGETIFLVWEA